LRALSVALSEVTANRLAEARRPAHPKLVFVYGKTSGRSRQLESSLAQVLQHRHNHDTFDLVRVCAESHPKLVEQLEVKELPTLLVIEERAISLRLETPSGRAEIQAALRRWLK
jgi:thioredoxin-like negative regulator of GroEL